MQTSRLEYCGLTSKLCTAADLESSWASYWLKRLQIDFAYHRKSWELCFVLQSLYENLNVFEEEGTWLCLWNREDSQLPCIPWSNRDCN